MKKLSRVMLDLIQKYSGMSNFSCCWHDRHAKGMLCRDSLSLSLSVCVSLSTH